MASFRISELPNFLEVDLLNRLRAAMKAPIIEPITDLIMDVITLDDILRTTGQEVEITEIEFESDGTLTYEGRRVILYIRDVTAYGGELKLPKFHLANCPTLQEMWKKKRSARYVVSTRHDGRFRLNISLDGNSWDAKEQPLGICRFCLNELNWRNYREAKKHERDKIYEEFRLDSFFEKYINSPVTFRPSHNDVTAPLNDYSDDQDKISSRYRESVGWKCEQCSADLSDKSLRRYLHVHHKDASKNNNSLDNLQALCIECHCKQELHTHLGNSGELTDYLRLKLQGSSKAGGAERHAGDPDVGTLGKIIISCPNCFGKLRLPTGKMMNVTCSHCKHEFFAST